MATLVSIVYPDQERARKVRNVLARLQTEYLVDVADAVVVTRDDKGKVHLDQSAPLVEMGAMNGALWGMLIGLLFFAPLLGAAVGAASGALAGKFSDYGIDDNFMRALGQKLQPNNSALFVLARGGTPERVLPEIAPYGGTVLQTSLPPDAEARLQAALNQGRPQEQEQPAQGLAA
jgi:uncharacterized membrane protein